MYRELTVEELNRICNPGLFDFETTMDMPVVEGTIGQERALRALEFGLEFDGSQGFNIYILGEQGTGKMTTIRNLLEKKASSEPVPNDQCYVYNFSRPDNPSLLEFPTGVGVLFQRDMDELIKVLRSEIPKVFESKEYERQKSDIIEALQIKQRKLFSDLEEEAKEKSFSIRKMPRGLVMAPIKKDGEPLSDDEYEALDSEMKQAIETTGKSLQDKLDDVVRQVRQEEKAAKEAMEDLDREAVLGAIAGWISELQSKYRDYEDVTSYLGAVKEDVLANVGDFKAAEEGGQQQAMAMVFGRATGEKDFTRYKVNVLVDNKDTRGAPVVIESNPTYLNLFGRVEHRVQNGMAFTDFTMIKAGSVHRANGGYLVVESLDLLKNIFSYEGLKRVLRNKKIAMDDVWEQYRMISTATMRPEAMPLKLKVVLVGSPFIYYILYNLDEEFRNLFKVKADFDGRMKRDNDSVVKYASFIANRCSAESLRPVDRSGVASLVQYGSRLAEHQEKLSARFGMVADILREADYWAGKAGSDVITEEHVQKARKEKIYRNSRIEDLIQEATLEDTFIVETSGKKVGQINGLAVLGTGDYIFGKPSRITSRVFAGKAGVVNIERETKMSGKIHEKAIMILSSYLGGKYAHKKPISLSASIGFEQLYEGIEGDSATCAEVYVLLSGIAGIPLRQDLAVTGSMDQHGEVQPIGGVNEKIEGFFDLCVARGLDGNHGCIIPARNVRNLLLKQEVMDAVGEGKFHIYPIDRVEQGLEILTGMQTGDMDQNDEYPEGTINRMVMDRLTALARAQRPEKKDEGNSNNENNEEWKKHRED